MGIFRWEKREIFFFIPHYNYPPFFEKNKLAIFFILSAILQLSPTTIIPPPPLHGAKNRLAKEVLSVVSQSPLLLKTATWRGQFFRANRDYAPRVERMEIHT